MNLGEPRQGWVRCDGLVLDDAAMAASIPMLASELEAFADPIQTVEDWLLHASDHTLAELASFIDHSINPSADPAHLIEQLGNAGVALSNLIDGARSPER